MLNSDIYEIKYIKYKTKYLQLKDLKGGNYRTNETLYSLSNDKKENTPDNRKYYQDLEVGDKIIIFVQYTFFSYFKSITPCINRSNIKKSGDYKQTICGFLDLNELVKRFGTVKAFRVRLDTNSNTYTCNELDTQTLLVKEEQTETTGRTSNSGLILNAFCNTDINYVDKFKNHILTVIGKTGCNGCAIISLPNDNGFVVPELVYGITNYVGNSNGPNYTCEEVYINEGMIEGYKRQSNAL